MTNNRIIGERLKELRISKKEKQTDVAEMLSAPRQIVSYYETGARTPTAKNLAMLAKHFNTSVDYILGLSDAVSTDIVPKPRMTKAECEAKIAEKMRKIFEIYEKYNPKANYLSCVCVNGLLFICNEHWGCDSQHPIRYEEEFDPTETDGEQE